MSRPHAWGGIFGIGLFGTLLTIGVAFGVYWMLPYIAGRFWVAWLLTLACCYPFLFMIMPRPVFFSIILFCVVLLFEANHTGRIEVLHWLPLTFFCRPICIFSSSTGFARLGCCWVLAY